ncbi:signal protein PDZ [bacterium SCGC AG-212-C10]|nr:signal protein PDZ [bacterium SCGC AG-212-C10]
MDRETTALTELSDALAAAVERAGASIVTVNARRRISASGVVWSADGVIVTCDHVIERDENITVTLADGRELPATIAGRDPGTDIAVLKVQATGLTPVVRAADGSAKTGHIVLATGRPSSGGPMASLGVISAVGGSWRTFRGHAVDGYLRTDASFFPGFSGGPLVDAAGAVVGIISSRLGRGAGLVLPVAVVAKVADQLSRQGKLRRGYLGISSQVVRLPGALSQQLSGQEHGLLVVQVEPGSPAESGGLILGDILVAIGGSALNATDDLQASLGAERVGQATAITVLRGGEKRDLQVTIGERA